MNRAIEKRRVQTLPINMRAGVAKQNTLLVELDSMLDKFTVELHRVVGQWTSAKMDAREAFAWPNTQADRVGKATACALAETTAKGWGGKLSTAIATCRKLRAAAAAGVLSNNDAELTELRSLVRKI